ncbi:hypothetical protein I4U23_008472 [Adineta vaga]|nr:hypothetical protein I4U23_008472 [Adineta vaga]
MHCCDMARNGQTLPSQLPEEWLQISAMQHDRTDISSKSNDNLTYANLNQKLQETINATNTPERIPGNSPIQSAESAENERKAALATYEEKRLKNYEDGNRELERRRQQLRELEEREQKEREERERKREAELQKYREEQERKKQMEIERQLEKQRQIEQQKEEERKKLYEQREAARKELERKNRLEWERQRMQELLSQKSRLLEQSNDLKSREKALGLELESMDDTMQTCQTKINQTETTIHSIDEAIADVQRNIATERNLFENVEQQKKDLMVQLNALQVERESLGSSVNQLIQSKEFSNGNRELDQIQYLQSQIETMNQESIQVDEQITVTNDQCKDYQNQMEQLRLQLEQLEQEAKDKKPLSNVASPTNSPAEFANFDQFNANVTSDDINMQSSDVSSSLPNVAPTTTADAAAETATITSSSPPPPPPPTVDVDPFQAVDPFSSHSDVVSTTENSGWFQPSNNESTPVMVDPFLPKVEPSVTVSVVASPKVKKAAPKATPNLKDAPKQSSTVDPWGTPATTNNNGNTWAQFDNNDKSNSSFGTNNDWPQSTPAVNENPAAEIIQYRVLYDYASERPDEMTIYSGDIIAIDPTKQQDDHWLFGRIGDDKQGFFPAGYAERIISTSTNDTTSSQLPSGSWVITLAECQGKTVDKHLSFQKDEFIHVREQKDDTWYSGQLHDKIGWFPRTYVRPATEVEIANKENLSKTSPTIEKSSNSIVTQKSVSTNDVECDNIYEAIYSYEATDSSDLSFDVGEHIIVLKRDGDWWTGQIGERTGTFPNNYVQKIGNIEEIAIAIDQTIFITKKDDNGWYQGEVRLPDQPVRIGWFPADHVRTDTTVSSTLPSASSDQKTTDSQHYIAIFSYDAQHDDELSFPADAVLDILDPENTSGWFKARLGDQVGLIPSTYVQQIDTHNQSSAPTTSKHKRHSLHNHKTAFTITCPSSKSCYLSPNIIPCTPTTANSSQQPFCDDTTITSTDDSSTLITESLSSHHIIANNFSRISAIRELIETEQRYVNDLSTVANEFIKPLSNGRILSDHEIEQLFSNWFSLIACNSVFLSTLQDQVNYREHVLTFDDDNICIRTPRSASMSNIAGIANIPMKLFAEGDLNQPSSTNMFTGKRSLTIERLDDNIVPQSSSLSSSHVSSNMIINESTRIGEILCSYIPYMADVYFQYCNCRSQANKYLQSKITSNKQFRSYLKIFQTKTGGLSLNGFLTKPIQRVTRYPLLIEKILKHTSLDHPDYQFIQRAYECARQLNERINKQICEQENSVRLDWLQRHFSFSCDEDSSDGYIFDEFVKFNSRTKFHTQRQLLLHGFIAKMPSGKELLVFLFNDFLLFSTSKVSSTNWQAQLFERKANLQLKIYRLPLFLTDVIAASESVTDQLTFSIVTKIYEKPLVLRTQQANIRTLWVRAINNALNELHTIEKLIVTNKALLAIDDDNEYETKPAIARLILVVQEAHNLMPSIPTLERFRIVNPFCEITVGALTLKTPYVKRSANPKWNIPMQFLLHNLVEDIIHINLYDNKYFSADDNIGSTAIRLADILPCSLETFLTQPPNAFTRTIYLNNGSSLVIKCLVQFLVPYH